MVEQLIIGALQWISQQLGVSMLYSRIGLLRVVFAIIFFGYIGISDYRTRRIKQHLTGPFSIDVPEIIKDTRLENALHIENDKWTPGIPIWKLAVLFATALLAYEMANTVPAIVWPRIALNVAIATILGLALYWVPSKIAPRWKLFHMGDLKALLLIGLLIPTYPFAGPFPIFRPSPHMFRLFIIAVLQWTAALGILYIIGSTVRMQLMSSSKFEFPDSLLGYEIQTDTITDRLHRRVLHRDGKITFDGLEAKFVDDYLNWRQSEDTVSTIEKFSDMDKVYLRQFLSAENEWVDYQTLVDEHGRDEVDKFLAEDEEYILEVAQKDRIWVLPEIPLVTIMAGGVILASLLGDPIFAVLSTI